MSIAQVYRAAPIIKYMIGWTIAAVADYCHKKEWELIVLMEPLEIPEANNDNEKV